MRKLKVHIMYEYGVDMRPHGSPYLRFIRPYTHPSICEQVDVTFGRNLGDTQPDLVFIDRLWKPDIDPVKTRDLIEEVHKREAKLIYWFDDNFLEIHAGAGERRARERRTESFKLFLEKSDGFVVTTPGLKETFMDANRKMIVMPSALDERLIVKKPIPLKNRDEKIVIGYMGTPTHDEDLRIIIPSLHAINRKFPGRVRFQFIGIMDEKKLNEWDELKGLSIEIPGPQPMEVEYPPFMVWFTGMTRWDIALAPLANSPFNRCKSDIKFLDYSAASTSSICSKVPAYMSTVEDRHTGLILENDPDLWTSAIEELIENESFRHDLIQNASQYLFEKRILLKCSQEFIDVLHAFA